MKKQILSIFTSLILVMSLLAVLPVMTASAEVLQDGDYAYDLLDNGTARIVQYNGTGKNVSIPATIKGKKVTVIGSTAFSYNYNIESVNIPSGVVTIESAAFSYCKAMTSVTIPNTVESIQDEAFLTCDALTSVNIPASTTDIATFAFSDCNKLTSINVADENTVYSSGNGLVYDKSGHTLVMVPAGKTTVSLPFGVDKIGNYAFYGSNITSVTIPGSVSEIGLYSFASCNNLTSIALPNVTKICNFAFDSCQKLSKVTLGSGVKTIMNYAFFCCPALKSVVVPKTVKTIYAGAFGYSCRDVNEDIEYYPVDDFLLYCYPNSAAVTYAKKNNVKYKLILPKVTGFKVLATSTTKVKLTCNKQAGAKGYIYYQYNPTTKKWGRIGKTISNTYLASNLKAGTTYKFAVKAYTTSGTTEVSSYEYPTVVTSTLPANVALTVTAGSKKATLTWKKAAGVTGYLAYYKTSPNAKWQGLAKTAGTTVTKTGLPSGKTCYFTIRAYRTVNGKNYFGAFTTKNVKIK